MTHEIFKKHPHYLCEVSNLGNVRYLDQEPARLITDRYLSAVVCTIHGKSLPKLIHRLVVETFIGAIPKGLVVNHIDANKLNNVLSNLEVITAKENCAHAISLGLWTPRKGQNHRFAKLTDSDVLSMYKAFESGVKDSDLADFFNIDFRTVSQIRNGTRWAHLHASYFGDSKPPKSLKSMKLSLEQALSLLEDLDHYKNFEIAEKYNLDRSTISRIRSRQQWEGIWKIYDNRCATTIENTSRDGSE